MWKANVWTRLQACNQQLLVYDKDVHKLLSTVATLTAERKRLASALADAGNAARTAEARCERQDEELASLRHKVCDLEATVELLQAKVSLQAKASQPHHSQRRGAGAPRSGDDNEPTSDYFKEQLVIAKVKLAEASGACSRRPGVLLCPCARLTCREPVRAQPAMTCT